MDGLGAKLLGKFTLIRDKTHACMIDGTSLSYYADLTCEGSTPFCRKVCYAAKYPQGLLDTSYRLSDFHPDVTSDLFNSSQRITFFGRGTLVNFDVDIEELIMKLGQWHPDKLFRFYVRSIPNDFDCPENCVVQIAVDWSSNVAISDLLSSKVLQTIGVIEHEDNAELIADLSLVLPRTYCDGTLCSTCGFPNFCNPARKTMLVQKLMQ